jgi:hypothetical protein
MPKRKPPQDVRAEFERLGLLGDQVTNIWGPPGSGKTHALQKHATRAVQAYGADKVIITSMTNAAKHEVQQRGIPLTDLDKQVRTTHSLAYEALNRPQMTEDKDVILAWNHWITKVKGMPIFARALPAGKHVGKEAQVGGAEIWEDMTDQSDGDRLFSQYILVRAREQVLGDQNFQLQTFANLWEEFKHGHEEPASGWSDTDLPQYCDWEDLIHYAYTMTDYCPGQPMALFGDEGQDWSITEWKLIRKWGQQARRLVVAGDPDQTIMEFAGADAAAFDNPNAQNLHLKQSYRVPKKVHAFALKWIRQIAERTDQEYLPTDDEGEIYACRFSLAQPGNILNLIESDLARGETVLVMATCGYMLKPIIKEARERGLPFANPYRPSNRAWNPLGGVNGTRSADRLLALHYADPLTWPELFPEDTERWHPEWYLPTWAQLHAFLPWLQASVFARRGAKSEAVEAAANAVHEHTEGRVPYEQLVSWFTAETISMWTADSGALLTWLEESLVPTSRDQALYPIIVARKRGAAALRQEREPLLRFSTGHAAKGTQAKNVYIDPTLSPKGGADYETTRGRAAAIRLGYVMLTRSQHKAVILSPSDSHSMKMR